MGRYVRVYGSRVGLGAGPTPEGELAPPPDPGAGVDRTPWSVPGYTQEEWNAQWDDKRNSPAGRFFYALRDDVRAGKMSAAEASALWTSDGRRMRGWEAMTCAMSGKSGASGGWHRCTQYKPDAGVGTFKNAENQYLWALRQQELAADITERREAGETVLTTIEDVEAFGAEGAADLERYREEEARTDVLRWIEPPTDQEPGGFVPEPVDGEAAAGEEERPWWVMPAAIAGALILFAGARRR
jgi:hypothetical protein